MPSAQPVAELLDEGRLIISDGGFIAVTADSETRARAFLPVPAVPGGPEPVPARSQKEQQSPGPVPRSRGGIPGTGDRDAPPLPLVDR